jgi:glucosamine 6-phosphate synthetase-like amidotransferase/phosphosugar isomerase protein
MCGIFAYLNYNVSRERRYILEVLLNGLRRLEYRGYDSSGIAVDADLPQLTSSAPAPPYAGAAPLVYRQEGKIENLVRSVYSGERVLSGSGYALFLFACLAVVSSIERRNFRRYFTR